MSIPLLHRDIYEITADATPIQGAKVRGRVRKFALDTQQNLLVENDENSEKIVRFAVLTGSDITIVSDYIMSIIPDAHITSMMTNVANPTLSKLKINDVTRYV
jgi:hypothetical protein